MSYCENCARLTAELEGARKAADDMHNLWQAMEVAYKKSNSNNAALRDELSKTNIQRNCEIEENRVLRERIRQLEGVAVSKEEMLSLLHRVFGHPTTCEKVADAILALLKREGK